MVLFDAGAAVPADRPGLDGGQARGGGGGGPRGRGPPQQTGVQTPPQTLRMQAQDTMITAHSWRMPPNDLLLI